MIASTGRSVVGLVLAFVAGAAGVIAAVVHVPPRLSTNYASRLDFFVAHSPDATPSSSISVWK